MTIQKGTIVKYNNQWFRVTKATKNTVNLGSTKKRKIPINVKIHNKKGELKTILFYWSSFEP